jgi:hypothetical protein
MNPETYDPNPKSADCDCNHAPCEHKVKACPVRHRIEELRSCPAYETHIEELEALALKVLEDGEEQISMLTEVLEDTEQVRDSWCEAYTKERDAHRETCKNAQAEIDKLHTENICLQELIQEFYEWSRRDYPTEAEVGEMMDRYYNLLNHNPNNKPS